MNELEFNALVANGCVSELKGELAFLRSERKRLSTDFLRVDGKLVERQKRVVEALAQRQEALLEGELK